MHEPRGAGRPTPSEVLDREAERLAARHRARLQRMTTDALARARPPRRPAAWLAVPAAALGMALMAALVVWQGRHARPAPPPLAEAPADGLPAWVLDDSAPLSLLENLDFYEWLAEQEDDGAG